MTKKHASAAESTLATVAEGIINDVEKLVGDHVDARGCGYNAR
jgi:hypothetical protein